MKFFKKALVASAILSATTAAYAAKVTPSVTQLMISKEGIASNVAVPDAGFDFNVKVETATPAASQIKILFGAGVDLTTPKAALTGTVTQTAAPNGSSSDGDVTITFGTGSFTFENIQIDTTTADAHFLTFDVDVGQPMINGAAFNIAFASGKVANAATATYTATDAGTVIDSGVGPISAEADQYGFAVKTPLNNLIKRDDTTVFTNTTTTDDLVFTVSDNQTLSRAVTVSTYDIDVTGNFKDVIAADLTEAVAGAATFTTADKVINLPLAPADIVLTGAGTDITLEIDPAQDATDVIIPETGAVKVDFTVTSANLTGGSLKQTVGADGGEWALDATIINVPYLPVGKEGTSSSVHLSNETAVDVDVIVSAIDQDGTVYPAVDLGLDLPKQTVYKVSQTALMELFSIEAGSVTKLSVTFNIDADKGDVNGYAFTTDETGRTEISTSQQRGN
jgi:hypothetical protein